MRNYVIINGVNSLTIPGLAIKTLPPITKPLQRTLREEIDGRDGDIITELGYGAYDKTITIGLFGNFNIDNVIAFFNQKGTITFSNESDKVYYFQALDQVDYESLLKFREADIDLHCQPFKYPVTETPIEKEKQYITVEGESITINDTEEAPMRNLLKGNTSQITTTQSSNLFDEKKYLTETFTTGTYKYALANFKGNRNLYIKAQVKSGKTAISDLFVAFTTNGTNPNSGTSHFVIRYNGVNNGSIDFTGYDNLYIAYYPTSYTWQQINDVYDIWVSTNDVNYTPFVPNSPSPDYPQDVDVVSGDNEINVCGKNYIGLGTQLNGYNNNGGNIQQDDTSIAYYFKTSELPDTLTFNCVGGNRSNVTYYNSVPTYGLATLEKSNSNDLPRTINVNKTYEYIYIQFSYGITNVSNIMLNEGSTTQPYEPYNGDTYNIDLPVENLVNRTTCNENTTLTWVAGENYNQTGSITTDYIVAKGGEIFSTSYRANVFVYDTNKTYLGNMNGNGDLITSTGTDFNTFTLPSNSSIAYIRLAYRTSANTGVDLLTANLQLERGSKINSFTPYGTTPIELCKIGNYQDQFKKATGKNLAPINLESETYNTLEITNNNNGTFTLLGNPTGSFGRDIATNLTLKAGTYTISANSMPSGLYIALDNETDTQLSNGTLSKTFTLASDTTYTSLGIWFTKNKDYDVTIKLQIEKSSSATEWQPKEGWYKEQQVKKVKISDLTWYYASTNAYFYSVVEDILVEQTSTMFKGYSNIYKSVDSASTSNWANKPNNSIGMRNTYNYLCVKDTAYTDTTNFTTNRGEGIVYYTLATPTNESIPTSLINQLEELYIAKSKENQTNISQINNDLGFIISASALKKGNVAITNQGNIYSKPTINIEGTGNVTIYLNGSEVLAVDLSEENEITIDTEKMEAYTETSLANRKVVGDYSKIKLNPGSNELYFYGDYTQATITKYTRWV